jgi:Ca-activated chloride channel family protein
VMRKCLYLSWVVLLSVALFGMAKLASQERPPGTYTISDNVDLVVLDAVVRNPHDGYVSGLEEKNFRVFDDGHPRQITQFASVDTPVTIGLVVDNSGSMLRKRPEVVVSGLAFAKQSNPKDDFFVVNFNNAVIRGLPANMLFTDNLQILRSALYYGEPRGQTALYDAIAYSLRHLELSRQERRALIVVSDGGDNVSTTRLPELIRLIEASRATIYTVGLFDPEAHDLNPGVLRRLASVSGGEYSEPELHGVPGVFTKISKDLRNRYTLAYVPDETNDRRIVRTVKVTAEQNGRKLFVRTRTAYTIKPFSELVAQKSVQR